MQWTVCFGTYNMVRGHSEPQEGRAIPKKGSPLEVVLPAIDTPGIGGSSVVPKDGHHVERLRAPYAVR